MQLKGLVRFFTILLIIYSLYQMSFTLVVKSFEKKMMGKAKAYVSKNYDAPAAKYPNDSLARAIYSEQLDKIRDRYADSLIRINENTIVTYGVNGKVSYKRAKEEELNLGLDLQGGMNVTLEVEMTGLLKSLAGGTNDPTFLKAIQNADNRKANSDADYITLFSEEFKKLDPNRTLASFFALGSNGDVEMNASDSKVISYLKGKAKTAFDNTYKVLSTRIDQFGVAQPTINPNSEKGIITVELPGIKDKERVRKILVSTANLQFWEVYPLVSVKGGSKAITEYGDGWQKAIQYFGTRYGGVTDTTGKKDTLKTNNNPDTPLAGQRVDTPKTGGIAGLNEDEEDTAGGKTTTATTGEKLSLESMIRFVQSDFYIGMVDVRDTLRLRKYLDEFQQFFPRDAKLVYGQVGKDGETKGLATLYALRTYNRDVAPIEGDVITKAAMDYDQRAGRQQPVVTMSMNRDGENEWAKMTKKSAEEQIPIAIVLDDVVYSAPIAEGELRGSSQISGNFTVPEAQDLAKLLEIGKLPAPAKIVAEQQVGPTLGRKALNAGATSFIISFVVIFLLMLVYYNSSGWVANIALILNLLFTVGILAGLGATLTAPGIAGLVLTIGMAVDTNVIIYERIKEELKRGKGYIPAINEGYRRSLPPVLDGHITILLTAIILFYFGLGPVKGFATTQIIGILLSLFCGILVSRWVTEWFTSKKKHLEYFTGISKRVFQHAKFKFIEYRKVAYIISFVVLGLGVASLFNGFDYGVEFDGGRSYTVQFPTKVDVEKTRDDLKKAFEGENPIIKTIGDDSRLDITTSYLIKDTRKEADSLVQVKLFEGLKNHFPPGYTIEKFRDDQSGESSKKVLPTISDDLKRGAVKATIFALIVIFIYIFLRFRDWRYSLGTIVALLHDVLVTLIVFSFARAIVPFPLEIDQHFIAAVLTVIGFSMNDTVIVFDRIREDRRLYPTAPLSDTINRAINETLSRTIMTSLTVFLTILILFIFGGEVTRGFAFAMLIGVITGTYSSIFVAAPILVDLGGAGNKKAADTKSVSGKS
ncbi:MAG: protein translocase subunit SecDF [Chitinophagaceae bacterium]|nr:protein translocase subunit SecDF [Chitinophagaceae bacterium]